MQANYRIVKADKSKFDIYEVKTSHVIKSFKNYDDARTYIRKSLRVGANRGFAGWTPAFFLKEFKVV